MLLLCACLPCFFFQAEEGIRDSSVTGVQTCALPIFVPVPANTAMDLFSRPDQSGPGTASARSSWTNGLSRYPSAQASISNRRLYVQTASQITDYDNWIGNAGNSYSNELIAVDFNMITVVQDPSYQHGPRLLARVQDSTTWIELAVNEVNGTLALWVSDRNNWTELTEASLATTPNQWYHAKLWVWQNQVNAKVWAYGTAEPNWQ